MIKKLYIYILCVYTHTHTRIYIILCECNSKCNVFVHNLIISTVLQMMVQITDLQTLTFYFAELYTIDGNAFGRPCQFPFLYEKKWYADCTNVDTQPQRLWCSIETDYTVNQLWGYCPTPDSRFISYSLYIWIVTSMINIKSLRLQLLLVHRWKLN